VLQLHGSKDADFFNEDHNYNKILGDALKLKANAMSKVHYWIDNKEVWASDHHKRKILDAARLVYGRRVNEFLDAKQSGDVNAIKMLARQLCIEEGFMARDLDEVDDNGETPLHVAAAGGNLSAVKLLVDGGADVDLGDSEGRYKTYADVL
jgi:ankyrin repeat protein